jgi:hypothetical protein
MAASTETARTNGQTTIPTMWRERILKRDFEIVLGKMLQPDQGREDETDAPYLRSANVQWDGVDLSDVKTMWFSPAEKRDLLLREGDLVVNEGGDVGRCAIFLFSKLSQPSPREDIGFHKVSLLLALQSQACRLHRCDGFKDHYCAFDSRKARPRALAQCPFAGATAHHSVSGRKLCGD